MDKFFEFWNWLMSTNVLNFVVMVALLYYISVKFDFAGKLEQARLRVVDSIRESEAEKKRSEEEFEKKAEEASHIDEEIYNALNIAEKSANALGKKMLEDAKVITRGIITSTQKRIDAKMSLLQAELMKKTALAAVEVAKQNIEQELAEHLELHDKFIYESLNALDEVRQ